MNFYKNGQQMWLSTAVLMKLNENTRRTVALSHLFVYLKMFTWASPAQDCQPCLTSKHTRQCHSYKFTWKDFHMDHSQYLLITSQFLMFSPPFSYLKMQILKFLNDNLLIILYGREYWSLTWRNEHRQEYYGKGCFWRYLDIKRCK